MVKGYELSLLMGHSNLGSARYKVLLASKRHLARGVFWSSHDPCL